MSEYETASLAIQEATLVLQQQGLIAAYLQAGVALLVGLAQCGLIAWGIKKMDASNQRRERQEAQAEARYEESTRRAEARHEETMLFLRQQGEALKQQGEALKQQGEALKQQGEAWRTSHEETMLALKQQGEAWRTSNAETMLTLRQQGEALRTLIERTAPQQ